jgi:hypothetical protein
MGEGNRLQGHIDHFRPGGAYGSNYEAANISVSSADAVSLFHGWTVAMITSGAVVPGAADADPTQYMQIMSTWSDSRQATTVDTGRCQDTCELWHREG